MLFTITGPPREILPLTLKDVADVLTSVCPRMFWTIATFYGRGRPDRSFPEGRVYVDFEAAVQSGLTAVDSVTLCTIAEATDDIYDILIVGASDGAEIVVPDGMNSTERFLKLAEQCEIVAECVDSSFWLVGGRDESRVNCLRDRFAEFPSVVVTT